MITERTAPRRLIVNADDFGMTEGINRAIAELHDAGVLNSATLMAQGPAFDDAMSVATARPGLGVGCHVVLVDGVPVLPAADLSTLAPGGTFRGTLGEFVRAIMTRRINEAEIEAEAMAQIQRLQDAGATVDHVDTHKHTHMFPAVLRPVLRAAVRCGVTAIRNPFESSRVIHGPLQRALQVKTLRLFFRGAFLLSCAAEGVRTTPGALGVAATGSLDSSRLRAVLAASDGDRYELVCHPGYDDMALRVARTRLQASREVELMAVGEVLGTEVRAGRLLVESFREALHDGSACGHPGAPGHREAAG